MDSFEILGIAPTKDVKEIRRSYSKLLTQYSPEKDPEGFKRLRAAYEDAISIANKEEDTSKVVLSPLDEFMETFEANYSCFEKRLNIDLWKELLESDVCYNIDTSKEVSYKILDFIIDKYNFPSEVWSLFNSYFSWTSKKEILYDKYPRNFIDFVIYKINNISTFDYENLKGCKDNKQDVFISEFRNLDNSLEDFDLYTGYVSMKLAQEIAPNHPGLLILIGRYLSLNGEIEESEKVFTDLINNNPNNLDAYFYRAELYFKIGNLRNAYEDYKMVLNLEVNSPGAWYALSKCCICLKKYEEAILYSEKLSDIAMYRQDISIILRSAYNFYIDSLLEDMKQGVMDNDTKLKLADAYFKTLKKDESYNILNELMQSTEATSDMYLLLCKLLVEQQNIELAYINICKALDLFENNYELNLFKANILDDLGKYEESIEQYDKSITINENDSSAFNNKAFVLNKLNRYNEALECAKKAIELNERSSHHYKNKAVALFGLELYEDCLDACEEALNKYQNFTEVYIIKMKAFIVMNLLDEALRVYNKASDYGLKDSKLYYEKARVLMYSRKYEDAINYCDLALELDENNTDFYYIKGLSYYYNEEDNEAIECFDSAIKLDVKYTNAYYYKVRCLLNSSKNEEALVVSNQAIDLKLEYLNKFYGFKGYILNELEKYQDAILEYKKAIEIEPESSYYNSIGYAYSEMDKFNEAIEYYSTFIDLEPNKVGGYASMSHCLYNIGKYNECIEFCNTAINIDNEYPIAHQNKGWGLYKLNEIEKAEVECNIALKLGGDNIDVLLLKLRILMFKKKDQEALVVCDRILQLNEDDENVITIRKELLDKVTGMKTEKKGLFRSLFK